MVFAGIPVLFEIYVLQSFKDWKSLKHSWLHHLHTACKHTSRIQSLINIHAEHSGRQFTLKRTCRFFAKERFYKQKKVQAKSSLTLMKLIVFNGSLCVFTRLSTGGSTAYSEYRSSSMCVFNQRPLSQSSGNQSVRSVYMSSSHCAQLQERPDSVGLERVSLSRKSRYIPISSRYHPNVTGSLILPEFGELLTTSYLSVGSGGGSSNWRQREVYARRALLSEKFSVIASRRAFPRRNVSWKSIPGSLSTDRQAIGIYPIVCLNIAL